MNDTLFDLLDCYIIVYLEDILMYPKTLNKILQNIAPICLVLACPQE